MKNINLREYYPSIYPNDFYITVSDDIAEVFRKSENTEKAYKKEEAKQSILFVGCRSQFGVPHSWIGALPYGALRTKTPSHDTLSSNGTLV